MKITNLSTDPLPITSVDGFSVFIAPQSTLTISPATVNSVPLSATDRVSITSAIYADNTLYPTESLMGDWLLGFGFGLSLMSFSVIIRLARRLTPSGGAGVDV